MHTGYSSICARFSLLALLSLGSQVERRSHLTHLTVQNLWTESCLVATKAILVILEPEIGRRMTVFFQAVQVMFFRRPATQRFTLRRAYVVRPNWKTGRRAERTHAVAKLMPGSESNCQRNQRSVGLYVRMFLHSICICICLRVCPFSLKWNFWPALNWLNPKNGEMRWDMIGFESATFSCLGHWDKFCYAT